ncbi:CobW family GTP-binding protein [Parasphingorhabdus cellanae]|uniref:GTP-binding protein n=1 Tax=Parasphingorhabdus cellanae TaxID=2806553 RepID=A0ABX7T5M5_9SPHN|nr:GTP-binding protein [Parasphingorhabdus cellanae]QTD56901.1 GTP-binding protein [Parasphingorhabdus cellanae]
MPDTRIPVSLITGFLGSGKTTLLNHLMPLPQMSKALVIINEFGSIGIDHDLVAHSNEDDTIVEMANGCLCCTIKGDLQKTLNEAPWRFARDGQRWFDRVLIETTGLADPAPIIHTVMADDKLKALYQLDAVIALVDGYNGNSTLDIQVEAVKQAAVADQLLISKTDIADAADIARLKARLRKLNPAAPMHLLPGETDDLARLFNGPTFNPKLKHEDVQAWLAAEAYKGGHHHHHESHDHSHDHDHAHDINRHDERIRSVCLTIEEPLPAQVFDSWLEMLVAFNGVNVLRVKGIIKLAELDKPLVIHGVQHIWHPPEILEKWPGDDRRSRIVFILRDLEETELRDMLTFVQNKSAKTSVVGLDSVG